MKKIDTLFVDIGGVVLTNGWDHKIREKAISAFHLEMDEFDLLHKEYYNLHECGILSLSEYLDKTIFYKKRDFSKNDFENFMKEQSKPYPDMLEYLKEIKKEHNLKVIALSNEGRELAKYRIHTFDLKSLFDAFIVSCFVGFQKPDPRIYQLTLDVTESDKESLIYIDDRSNLVQAAANFKIHGILHTTLESTKNELTKYL